MADTELYEHVDKVMQQNLDYVFHSLFVVLNCVPQAKLTMCELCCNDFITRCKRENREKAFIVAPN